MCVGTASDPAPESVKPTSPQMQVIRNAWDTALWKALRMLFTCMPFPPCISSNDQGFAPSACKGLQQIDSGMPHVIPSVPEAGYHKLSTSYARAFWPCLHHRFLKGWVLGCVRWDCLRPRAPESVKPPTPKNASHQKCMERKFMESGWNAHLMVQAIVCHKSILHA